MRPRRPTNRARPADGSPVPRGSRPRRRATISRVLAFPGSRPDFAALVRAHGLISAANAAVAIGLAGSLFFSVSPTAARGQVVLYLLLTMAPFAVVGPVIGPAMDRLRGSRRWVVVAATGGSATACVLMTDDLDHVLLFPEAFVVLVLGKSYAVAKSALVPAVVDTEDLVAANSYLALTSVAASAVAAVPAGVLSHFFGSPAVLTFAAVVFAVGLLAALRIPREEAQGSASTPTSPSAVPDHVLVGAARMAAIRGSAGFYAFFLAFTVRREGLSTAWLGVAVVATMTGTVLGNVVGPVLRRFGSERRVVGGCGLAVAAGAAAVALRPSLTAAVAFAVLLGSSAAAAKLSFDAMVQRAALDGIAAAFARFETRLQLAWVAGALAATALTINVRHGFLLVALAPLGTLITSSPRIRARLRDRRQRRVVPVAVPEARSNPL